MIIQCSQCNKKFRLDDSKVKERGVKVRCSKCGNIFIVKPSPKKLDVEKPVEKQIVEEKPKEEKLPESETIKKIEEEKPVIEKEPQIDKEVEKEPFFEEKPLFKEEEFKIDKREDFSEELEEKKESRLDFGEIDFGLEEKEKEFDIDKWEEFPGTDKESIEFSLEGDKTEEGTQEKELYEEEKIDEKEREIYEEETETKPQFEKDIESVKEPPKKGISGKLVLLYIILIILSAIIVYAGFQYWEKGYVDIPLIRGLFNLKGEKTGSIELKELNGYFLHNKNAGDIFVIEGKALNNYSTTKSFIRVKGVIIGEGGNIIHRKEVYCGNIFSRKELEELSPKDIETRLNIQFGESLSNLNIPPKKSIPFMIVFFNVPKNISEFNVDVISE